MLLIFYLLVTPVVTQHYVSIVKHPYPISNFTIVEACLPFGVFKTKG